ncbi:MAG: alpha/beta hydrolase [Phycisphaerales bacterium]|nr:alpha/beta hydrolase [Phycisphaerales bacterium]
MTVRPVAGTEAAGMSRVDFGYDSGWRRVRKTVTPWDEQASGWAGAPSLDRRFLWSGWRMLLEFDMPAGGPEDVIRKFTWGLDLAGLNGAVNSLESAGTIGGLLAVREYDVSGAPQPDDPADYVYLYDSLGNVGQVVDWSHTPSDPEGAIVAHYEYDPYGGVTKAQGDYAADNAWRFSTKQWDDETGLGYWGFRYYDAVIGRWMSRDPIGERGGLNFYLYGAGNPSAYIDGLGLYILVNARDSVKVVSLDLEWVHVSWVAHANDDYSMSDGEDLVESFECCDCVLVWVHGYNTNLEQARDSFASAESAYQGARGKCKVYGFAWRGDFSPIQFRRSMRSADITATGAFARFIKDLQNACPSTRLHIASHSLGARVVLGALQDGVSGIDQVILTSAAVSNSVFESGGEFEDAPLSANKTIIAFNRMDEVLRTPYQLSQLHAALGQTSVRAADRVPHASRLAEFDVTREWQTHHGGVYKSPQNAHFWRHVAPRIK